MLALIALALCGVSLVLNTGFVDAVFLFLLMGIVPGTNLVLPAWSMFSLAAIISVAALTWLRRQPLYIGSRSRQERTARALARRRVHKASKSRTRRRAKTATA